MRIDIVKHIEGNTLDRVVVEEGHVGLKITLRSVYKQAQLVHRYAVNHPDEPLSEIMLSSPELMTKIQVKEFMSKAITAMIAIRPYKTNSIYRAPRAAEIEAIHELVYYMYTAAFKYT